MRAMRPSQVPPRASVPPPPAIDPTVELAAIAAQLSPHGRSALLAHARKLRDEERIRGARPALLMLSPKDFAVRVQQAANEAPHGALSGKVLVSSVFRLLEERGETSGINLAEFKDRLLTAHRAGLLDLVRLEPSDRAETAGLAASEIRHLANTYHCIRKGGRTIEMA